ncbi:MAG: hypothetical protein EBT45_00290 [Alphaproteobacteria bacterium]|nr:hypothetical protein [Alphaproteobacteria bacterium]
MKKIFVKVVLSSVMIAGVFALGVDDAFARGSRCDYTNEKSCTRDSDCRWVSNRTRRGTTTYSCEKK